MDTQHPQSTSTKRLAIFTITESKGMSEKQVWTRIGAAFRNRDGSFNIHLDALPLAGRLHMREVEPERFRRGTLELDGEVLS